MVVLPGYSKQKKAYCPKRKNRFICSDVMATQFKTNQDVINFIGKDKEEFSRKFSFEEQLFLSLALIDHKDDGRLNPSAQKRIVEMDHSMKWNKKHIEKDLYDLLNTSHRNKYLFSDIVASYSIYKQDKVKQDNDLKLFQGNMEVEVQTYATDVLNVLLQ